MAKNVDYALSKKTDPFSNIGVLSVIDSIKIQKPVKKIQRRKNMYDTL